MFRGLIVVEDPVTSSALEQVALDSNLVTVTGTLNHVPRPYELARVMSVANPEVVFLQVDGTSEGSAAVDELRLRWPRTEIVEVRTKGRAFHRQEGISRPVLSPPFDFDEFGMVIEVCARALRQHVPENLWVFLPAKAGSGASTVAVQTAACLARDFRNKVLLIEGDLRSGVVADVLGVEPRRPVTEVLERAQCLEEAEWRRSVTSAQGMDLLPTNRARKLPLPMWSEWFKLLEFVQSRYDSVLVDLPEVINDATVEVVRRASRVWIVLTTELQSLALARQRCTELTGRGIPEKRVELIVNRWLKTDSKPKMIQELVGKSVAAVLPNDYRLVKAATMDGKIVSKASELGRGYAGLARTIAEPSAQIVPERPALLERLGIRRA